jgi:hypothetical protein
VIQPFYLWAAIGLTGLVALNLCRKAALCESLSLRFFFFHGLVPVRNGQPERDQGN